MNNLKYYYNPNNINIDYIVNFVVLHYPLLKAKNNSFCLIQEDDVY